MASLYDMMHEFAVILLFSLVLTTAAKDVNNYFGNPASRTGINPVWQIGQQQVISWKTTISEFNISLWQQSLVEQMAISQVNIFTKIYASDDITNFTWVVQPYSYDLEYSNVFFLWINADRPGGFVSSFFNITKAPTTSTTTTATASATGTGLADLPGSTSSSSTNSQAAAEGASTGLTMTSKIALGVGLGVGVPIVAALGVLICLRSRNANAKELPPAAREGPHPEVVPPNGVYPPPPSPPREMGGRELPVQCYPELPGQKH